MEDTVTYYEEAEKLARELQQHEHAASLHDEYNWHSQLMSRTRSMFSGDGGLAQRFDLVLPPVRSMIAIGIVICLLGIGAVTVARYDNTAAEPGSGSSTLTANNVSSTDLASKAPEETVVEGDDLYVGFKSIADNRNINYQLRLGVDFSKVSVDAFVVQVGSPERYPVTGSRCTRAVSGLNRTHQCVAALDPALPAGKYILEIDARAPDQPGTTVRTKRFMLK